MRSKKRSGVSCVRDIVIWGECTRWLGVGQGCFWVLIGIYGILRTDVEMSEKTTPPH